MSERAKQIDTNVTETDTTLLPDNRTDVAHAIGLDFQESRRQPSATTPEPAA